MKRLFILCLFWFVSSAVVAIAESSEPESAEPLLNATVTLREHGYTLGDMIEMHAEIVLDKRYAFDPNSLPLKGPITPWLDLRDIAFTREKMPDESELIQIDFKWQLFGTVAEAQLINTPEILLRTLPVEVVGNENQQTLLLHIPPHGFYLSPVLPEKLSDEEAPRPIIPPPRFDTATPLKLGLLNLALAFLLITYWLYIKDKIPWLPRHPGGMTLLARQIRAQGTAKQSHLSEADIRMIHARLAGCAGQSLYPNTLDVLFEKAPYLVHEQDNIRQFFEASWQLFHQENTTSDEISKDDTLAWIRRAAMAERARSL